MILKSRTRPLIAILAVSTMAVGLTACTAGDSSDDEGVITIFMPQDPDTDFDTNAFTVLIEEKFDVDLQFETTTYDSGGAAEARQISLASGNLPDAYMLISYIDQFSQAELLRLGDQGVIQPLNDLIEEHAPNIQKAMESTPEFATLATAPDGNIYGMPQWNDCYHCGHPTKFWINTEWLDTLGLEQPTTPDELFDVLMAFKTEDPNGNGVADEIPLTANASDPLVSYIMNAFIYNAWNQGGAGQPISIGVDGGKLQLQPAQDAWREGLVFLNKLWDNGMVDPGAFSQSRGAMQATGNSAEGSLVGAFSGAHPGIFVAIGQEDGRDKNYDPVPPLNGPAGQISHFVLPNITGAAFVISSSASEAKQQKLIEILDFIFTTEGHLQAEFGIEGVGWERPAEGDVALDPELEPLFVDLPHSPEAGNSGWGAASQYFSNAEFRNAQVQPLEIYGPEGYERRLFDATKLYEGLETDAMFDYWNIWVPVDLASELSTVQTNVEAYLTTSTAEFVTGTRDPSSDDDWQAYLDGLDGLGADKYLEIWQGAYDTQADPENG